MKAKYIAYNILSLVIISLIFASVSQQAMAAPSDIDTSGNIKTGGTTRISSTGVGTFASGTTVNGFSVGNITGQGSSGILAKFTAAGAIANSIVSESSNTLTVAGNISVPGAFYIGSGTAIANVSNAFAIGTSAQATGSAAIALGSSARATSTSIGMGSSAIANGSTSIAIGNAAQATQVSAQAIGNSAKATGVSAASYGAGATATGSNSLALAASANASGSSSIAIGVNSMASATNSMALGENARSTIANQFMIGNDSTVLNPYIYGSVRINSSSTTGSLVVGNSTITHLFVNGSSGNFGIGTTNPTRALYVNGTADQVAIFDRLGTGSSYITFMLNGTAKASIGYDNNIPGLSYWNSSGSQVFVIKEPGNVGIGTTAPTDPGGAFTPVLYLNGTQTGIGPSIVLSNPNESKIYKINLFRGVFEIIDASAGGVIAVNGTKVGINTTNPSAPLEVKGNVNISLGTSATPTSNGCLILPGGGKVCGNTSCTVIYSPDGNTKVEACN